MKKRDLSKPAYTLRDYHALLLLWHAKLLTTAALARWAYQSSPLPVAYKRMKKLERGGWIKQRPDWNGQRWYWSITKQAYRRLQPELPPLYDKGFETEFIDHDAAATAVHLATALAYQGTAMTYITEQWMRRVDREVWYEPIPRRLRHRPDGYWVQGRFHNPHIVALEFERQPKALKTYRERFSNYQWQLGIHRVVWVAADEKILRRLAKTLFALQPENEAKHTLFLWSDFVDHGIHMKARRGIDKGKTLAEIVSLNASRWSPEPVHRYFLDGSRTGVNSLPYRLAAEAAGVDCIMAPIGTNDSPLCTESFPLSDGGVFCPWSDRSLKTDTQPAVETPQGEDPWQL